MEQRPLRLGDILDDYCPRERRVTNHAIVAMVEEDVKQTRCTTCDAEHVYKGGKTPRRKKADGPAKLYKQVLAGLTDQETADAAAPLHAALIDEDDAPRQPTEPIAAVVHEAPAIVDHDHDDVDIDVEADAEEDEQPVFVDEGPVHRPLIRAQLPRLEGVKPERQAPDFTMRHAASRGNGSFRGHGGGAAGNGGAPRFGRGPQRSNGGQGRGSGGGGGQFGRQSQGPRNRRGR
jgi:hypothetical protein